MTNIPIQRGEQWLKTLLSFTGIKTEIKGSLEVAADSLNEDPSEPDNYWLTIDKSNLTPSEIQTLIGTDGSVLDAIQYLANSVLNLNQPEEEQAFYIVELGGYRAKRQAEIRSLAEAAAAEARFSGREVEIKSLSSAERRQIHTFFKEFGDLETFSRGREPHRHLVIRPIMDG
jgi:spoIIIJ-associated protein